MREVDDPVGLKGRGEEIVVLNDHSLHRVLGRHEQGARAGDIHRGDVVEPALGSADADPALVQPSRRFGSHRRRTFRSAWAVAGESSTRPPRRALSDGRARGHRAHAGPRFPAPPMTEPTPLAPSAPEAAAATERLAAWVIGALSTIVIGGVALVIYAPHGGQAAGSSSLPAIHASLNATATILLRTGYVLIRRRRVAPPRRC